MLFDRSFSLSLIQLYFYLYNYYLSLSISLVSELMFNFDLDRTGVTIDFGLHIIYPFLKTYMLG